METVYVGNLPWTATEEEIRGLFAEYGEVGTVQIIQNHETGRSKGYGFIEVENPQAAIDGLNGHDWGGRQLKVNSAFENKEKKPFQPREFQNSRPYPQQSGRDDMANKIYVGNLPWDVTREEIQKVFESYGEVRGVQLPTDPESGRPRGYGFVEMDNPQEALSNLRQFTLRDREVKVGPARQKNSGERNERGGGGGYRGGQGGGGYRGGQGGGGGGYRGGQGGGGGGYRGGQGGGGGGYRGGQGGGGGGYRGGNQQNAGNNYSEGGTGFRDSGNYRDNGNSYPRDEY